MAIGIAYVKTAKGKEEADSKPGRLSGGLKSLLALIDQTTIADLQSKLPQVPSDKLNAALDRLFVEGYIEIAASAPSSPAGAQEEELDFTRFISRPVKEPTIQQKRKAEATLAGIRTSKKAGYHVNIINRPEKPITPRAGGEAYTVLVIDADDANSLVVTRALLLARFETRAASKQDEIIVQLNKQPPADVIAMDLGQTTDVVGLELLGRLRQHPTYKSVPIIVMADKVEHSQLVAALAYGANGYMSKPVKPEAIVDSVKAVLGL
jgi:CheY-like chemotaxis protein